MRYIASGVVILAGVIGLTSEAVAGNRVPIISNTSALPATAATEYALTLAAATVKTITPAIVRKIEKEFANTCTVSENQSYVNGREAINAGMSPAIAVLAKLKYAYGIEIPMGAIKTVITQAPLHGKVSMIGLATQTLPGTTYEAFQYAPNKDYLGDDKVTFEVTVSGQKFSIGVVIHVQKLIDEGVCHPGEDRGEAKPQIQIALENIEPLVDDTNPTGLQSWLISNQRT